jgi:N-acetylglucosaminyldiphosphoundecaprenol N-acetyl-beta-D-mannosaminyltransferase
MAPERVLFGLPISAMTMTDVVDMCQDALRSRRRMLIGVVNAAKIVKLRQDELLRSSLLACDVLLADGQSVVWASRLLGQALPERVAGIDLFQQLLALADREQHSVYFLGARREVLGAMQADVTRRFPHLTVAGSRDGYFEAGQSATVADDIRRSAADMLFLGMTSPKKEIFLGTYGDSLGIPVLHGVGGSFDVLAGITKRAPVRWQRLGLEWLYRLLQEPARLSRRYLTTNSTFVWLTLKERIRPSPAYPRPAP